MSTDLHEHLSDAYPRTGIELPPAERLWERGRRRQRHRSVGIAVASIVAVTAVGFAAAGLVPPRSIPAPVTSEPSEPVGEASSSTPAEQETSPVPEPANEGDVAVADDAARFDLSIFLCDGRICPETVTPDQQQRLRQDLEAHPAVAEVFFESKEQAHERFRARFEDQPELADSVDLDALPASFRVKLHDPEQVRAVAEHFAAYAGVEEVLDQRNCSPGACDGFVPEVADRS